MFLDLPATVFRVFPAAGAVRAEPLSNHGGFSGAQIWRVITPAGDYCCRAWPPGVTAAQLAFIHAAMQRACQLEFVPRVLPTSNGETWLEANGRYFELTTWMRGQADFESAPSRPRVQQACLALAQLHEAWKDTQESGPCGAIARRLRHWERWTRLVASGWRPGFSAAPFDSVERLAQQAWHLLPPLIEQFPARLKPWA